VAPGAGQRAGTPRGKTPAGAQTLQAADVNEEAGRPRPGRLQPGVQDLGVVQQLDVPGLELHLQVERRVISDSLE